MEDWSEDCQNMLPQNQIHPEMIHVLYKHLHNGIQSHNIIIPCQL